MKKAWVAAGLLFASLRLATAAGGVDALAEWAKEAALGDRLVRASLLLELGNPADENETSDSAPSEAPPSETPGREVTTAVVYPPEPAEQAGSEAETGSEKDADADADADSSIVATNMANGLSIKNATNYNIDIPALLSEGLDIELEADQPQILIIHTHSSEAYTPSGGDDYEPSDISRTEDSNYNVIRVGKELASCFEGYGLSVVHDTGVYDYPSYTGSYSRSGTAVAEWLKKYPSISIVIDLHRDALEGNDIVYKTMAEENGDCSSQVMMVVGTDNSGLDHPKWKENLKLALYMQSALNRKYPTLARPVFVVKERYNQHLTTGSMILEVGSSGNTLQEALTAVRLFAAAAGPALASLKS